jgi:carotenoid cleavage dioxygenase-like enzyme
MLTQQQPAWPVDPFLQGNFTPVHEEIMDPLYVTIASMLKNRFHHRPAIKNPANTALIWHDRRLLALWEGGEPHEITLPILATVGPYTYGGQLTHPCTAHPKVDHTSGELLLFGCALSRPTHGQGHFGGEGIFVPQPNARTEDNGWLMTYVYDAADDTSALVVLEAQDFHATPLARMRIPARVPYGFHGVWITWREAGATKGGRADGGP